MDGALFINPVESVNILLFTSLNVPAVEELIAAILLLKLCETKEIVPLIDELINKDELCSDALVIDIVPLTDELTFDKLLLTLCDVNDIVPLTERDTSNNAAFDDDTEPLIKINVPPMLLLPPVNNALCVTATGTKLLFTS